MARDNTLEDYRKGKLVGHGFISITKFNMILFSYSVLTLPNSVAAKSCLM